MLVFNILIPNLVLGTVCSEYTPLVMQAKKFYYWKAHINIDRAFDELAAVGEARGDDFSEITQDEIHRRVSRCLAHAADGPGFNIYI